MNKLTKYLEDNFIEFEKIADNIVKINGKTYQIVYPNSEGKLFDDSFDMTCDDIEEDNYIFEFGGKWYSSPKGSETDPQLNLVKYLGKANIQPPLIPWLGIHGKYESLNGSREYRDWVTKGLFLGCSSLGICELDTLAGTFPFQEECLRNGVKPILGVTYTVSNLNTDEKYRVKLFVKNGDGWNNLLRLNKICLVDNTRFIPEDLFWTDLHDLVVVLDPKYLKFDRVKKSWLSNEIYYQLDSVRYEDTDSDREYLDNLAKFIKSTIKPILIQDSYYLDSEDSYIKGKLNQISGVREFKSSNQYFKTFDQIYDELDLMFSKESKTFELLIESATKNLLSVSDSCNFKITTGEKFLPKYKMTSEESSKFSDSEEMFDYLIREGLKRIKKLDNEEYLERVKIEKEIIEEGGFFDYFLILYDIIRHAKEKDILVGIGRGSSAGCLISYLLNITRIDPLPYDLLFERFLNRGRIGKSLPDIDTDFLSYRRDEIKDYIKEKYGEFQFCEVGTYTKLQMKASVKEMAKLRTALTFDELNKISRTIDLFRGKGTIDELFKLSTKSTVLKDFIKNNGDIVHDVELSLQSHKAESIHPCATLILPQEKDIFSWLPIKKIIKDGKECLVTEWEGEFLESLGFLKEDILGILQLDKFDKIIRSVKAETGKSIDIYNLPLNDSKVYKYFGKGWNGDVFHFGSTGLSEYCKYMKPKDINDLVAGISLYRPGGIEQNLHVEYVERKEKRKEVEYFPGTENATRETYGVIVYQEQIMKICQEVAGYSLVEADVIRKALGKTQVHKIKEFRGRFVEGAVERNFSESDADELWSSLEKFAKYCFNKSHAVAYSITGYISQYLKVHYPLHYWTCAFSFIPSGKKDDKIPSYISEIHQTGDIKMMPPEINHSSYGFTSNFETNSIYWSLDSVKQAGEKAVEQIIEDKKQNGEYFSFNEFLQRNVMKGSKVTKQVIENLVMSGAFDEVEQIKRTKDRWRLIQAYRDQFKVKVDKTKDLFSINEDELEYNWWWDLQQKRLSGFAFFDFRLLCENYLDSNNKYIDSIAIQDKENLDSYVTTGGYINSIVIKQSKRGEYADIILDDNFEFSIVKFWQDGWSLAKHLFEGKEKCLLLISGKVTYDKYKKRNIISTTENSDILILE